jgi:subtilisin family serine protease
MTPRPAPLLAAASLLAAATLIVAVPASASAADPGGHGVRSVPGAIAGQYVVVFADQHLSSAASQKRGADLAGRYGAQVRHAYGTAVKGFAGAMTAAQAAHLAQDPDVAYVEQDAPVSAATTQVNPPSWGLDRVDQRALPLDASYSAGNAGTGVTAYVIDSGIRTTHVQFGGRATIGADFIGNDGMNGSDCFGHGTHVAGTIGGRDYGVAKNIKLVAVRVLNCSGGGSVSGLVAGVDWVTAHALLPAVANVSIQAPPDDALDAAIRGSIAAGVTYTVAANNDFGDACNYSPSRVGEAITVSATTSSDVRASYANGGPCVDLFAPGDAITSATYTSDTDVAVMSGTSMAAPHAAGTAALYLSAHPGAAPAEVANALSANATPDRVGDPAGAPNLLLYSGFIGGSSAVAPHRLDLGSPATGSAACKAAQAAPQAVNGSVSGGVNDKWCSKASSKWLQVDLGASHQLTGAILDNAGAGGESPTYDTRAFRIGVSTDGTTWTTVATVTANTADVASQPLSAVTARYVRLYVDVATQVRDTSARIYEFEVYGY